MRSWIKTAATALAALAGGMVIGRVALPAPAAEATPRPARTVEVDRIPAGCISALEAANGPMDGLRYGSTGFGSDAETVKAAWDAWSAIVDGCQP